MGSWLFGRSLRSACDKSGTHESSTGATPGFIRSGCWLAVVARRDEVGWSSPHPKASSAVFNVLGLENQTLTGRVGSSSSLGSKSGAESVLRVSCRPGATLRFPFAGEFLLSAGLTNASAQGHEAMTQSFEERRGDHLHMKERGRAVFIHWVLVRFGSCGSCDYPALVLSEAEKKLKICSAFDLWPSGWAIPGEPLMGLLRLEFPF